MIKLTEQKIMDFINKYIIKDEVGLDSAKLLSQKEVNINDEEK
jgi:hypothetical protein